MEEIREYRIYYRRSKYGTIIRAWSNETETSKNKIVDNYKTGFLTIMQRIGKRFLNVEKYEKNKLTFKR